MSNTKHSDSGAAQGARRATEAGPESGRGGKGRWSAKRKTSVVLELLRGADLESTSRKFGVTAATLSEWREAFWAAGEEGLKIRQKELVHAQNRR
ncbi:MAG: helix-turn-helix domain-containing protein [Acidobacteriota bacterium]